MGKNKIKKKNLHHKIIDGSMRIVWDGKKS